MNYERVDSQENLRDRIFTVPTGDIPGSQYRKQLTGAGLSYVTAELNSPQLQKPQNKKDVDIILLLPGEFKTAQDQHLSLGDVPWDALPSILLNKQSRIPQGWTYTKQKAVADRYGDPIEFFVVRFGGYLGLYDSLAGRVPRSYDHVAVRVLRK